MRRDRRPAEQPPRSAVVTDGFLKRENYIDNVWQGFPIPTKRSVDVSVRLNHRTNRAKVRTGRRDSHKHRVRHTRAESITGWKGVLPTRDV